MFVASSAFYTAKAKQLKEQGDFAGAQRYEGLASEAKESEKSAKPQDFTKPINSQPSSKHIVFKAREEKEDRVNAQTSQLALGSQNPHSNLQRQATIARDADGRPTGIRSLHQRPEKKANSMAA